MSQLHDLLALIGRPATILHVDDVMGLTHRTEATVLAVTPERITFTPRGKRRAQAVRLEGDTLVLAGWDVPVRVDGDTNVFRGNACVNLVGVGDTTDPAKMRELLAQNVNPALRRGRVLLWPPDATLDTPPVVLYPEEAAREGSRPLEGYLEQQQQAARLSA